MAKGMRRGGIRAPIFNISGGEDEANSWNIHSDRGLKQYFMKQGAKFCKSCKKRRRYFSRAAPGFHKRELDPTTNIKYCKWWAPIFDSVLTEEISKTPTFSPSPRVSGHPDVRTNTRLHHGDHVRTQLWLRQDGELQDIAGQRGSGRSSVQTAQTGLRQQVRSCFCAFSGCGGRPYVFRMCIHANVAQAPEYISLNETHKDKYSQKTIHTLSQVITQRWFYIQKTAARWSISILSLELSYTCNMKLTKVRASILLKSAFISFYYIILRPV